MNISLCFYGQEDGIPTMKDSFILYLIDRVERDGALSSVFYGDADYTKLEFLRKIKTEPHNNLFFVVEVGDDLAGFGLLDHIRYDHAHCHFAFFKEYWGKGSVQIAQEVYWQLLERFSVLVGIVPADNLYAVKFCEKIKMKKTGVIPLYYHNDKIEKHVDGVVFHITKEV